jgi:uncharacterized membrane protein
MSTLIAIQYDDPFKAQEVRLLLLKLQKEYLIDMEDAVVAVKNKKGKIQLQQSINLTAAGAVTGGLWGTLIGMLFLSPLFGAAVGASAGAVSGALTNVCFPAKAYIRSYSLSSFLLTQSGRSLFSDQN